MAQIAVGVNVFMLDAGAAERRLEADPWVAEATISKHLPSTLVVDIQERSPVAVIESTGLLRLVAGDGTLLDAAGPGVSLPLIASAEATVPEPSPTAVHDAARAVAAMTPILRRQVAQVSIFADGTLRVDLRSGAPVSYGSAVDLVAKAERIAGAPALGVGAGGAHRVGGCPGSVGAHSSVGVGARADPGCHPIAQRDPTSCLTDLRFLSSVALST